MRIITLTVLAIVLCMPISTVAQDTTKGATCSPDTFHRFSLNTPTSVSPTGWPDFSAVLYYNNYASTFLMMLFDEDSDTVGLSSGYTRFVQMRLGLLPGKRYELWVGCVGASAAFRLLAMFGDVEAITGHGTVASAAPPGSFDAAEQVQILDREAEMRRWLREMAGTR